MATLLKGLPAVPPVKAHCDITFRRCQKRMDCNWMNYKWVSQTNTQIIMRLEGGGGG